MRMTTNFDESALIAEEWDRIKNHQKKMSLEQDTIDKPPHYNQGGIEAIEYIKQQLGGNYKGYLEGNVIKYLHRYKYKNGVEDLKKARWYLDQLILETTNEL